MNNTLLGLVQTFSQRQGLPNPLVAAGSQDQRVLQIVALMNEVIEDIIQEGSWQALNKIATFTSTATEDQGAIQTLAPFGYQYAFNDTFYDRTARLPLNGPLNAQQWEQCKAVVNLGPFYKYRLFGDHLLINPTMVAGHTIAFEYASTYAVYDPNTATYKQYFTLDTDQFVLMDALLIAGTTAKWRSTKGLPYATDEARYTNFLNNNLARNTPRAVLRLDNTNDSMMPGILVPAGNWPL